MQWWYWLAIALLAFLSMFFSSADMVYSVVNQSKLEDASNKGNKKAKIALNIAKDYEFSIASILFGNNLVNILASSIITLIGVWWNTKQGITWGTTVASVIFTVFIIIFAEFAPKSFSKKYSYSLAIIYAYPVIFFKYLTSPFVWPISKLFSLIGRLFKKKSKEEDQIDEDVLMNMVDELEETKEYDEQDAELVRSAIDINDVEAHEIMTPRVDVYAINIEDDLSEIIKKEKSLNILVFLFTKTQLIMSSAFCQLKNSLKRYLEKTKISIFYLYAISL